SNALGSNPAGLTNVTIQDGTAVAGRITPAGGGRGAVFDAIDRQAHATTRNIDLDTTYGSEEDTQFHFNIGYTDAEGNTDAQPFVEFSAATAFDYDLRGGVPRVHFLTLDTNNPNQMSFDFASMHKVTNDDSEFYTYADLNHAVDLGPLRELKAGL